VCYINLDDAGKLYLATRLHNHPTEAAAYVHYNLTALTGATPSGQPYITSFNNQLYVFWTVKGLNNTIWYTKSDSGESGWSTPVSVQDISSPDQVPSAIEYNGRLWLAWTNPASVADATPCFWLTSTRNGAEWDAPQKIYETQNANNMPFSFEHGISGELTNITLGTFDNQLWVFCRWAQPAGNAENIYHLSYAAIKPNPAVDCTVTLDPLREAWEFSDGRCSVTSARGRQFLVAWNPATWEVWSMDRDSGTNKNWKVPVNLAKTPAEAVTTVPPCATVLPGIPGDTPFRVWYLERGAQSNQIWEASLGY
jgi:hypothetical protein